MTELSEMQMPLDAVQRLEQRVQVRMVRLLRRGVPGVVHPFVHLAVHPLVHGIDVGSHRCGLNLLPAGWPRGGFGKGSLFVVPKPAGEEPPPLGQQYPRYST